MEKHVSLKQQVTNFLKDIEDSITRNNVKIILPLLKWNIKKIKLIVNAENKKSQVKFYRNQGKKPPLPLKCSRGEIWNAYLGYNIGSEQNGVEDFVRPVLIVQNDHNNTFSPNTIIVPLTKVENRQDLDIDSIKDSLRNTEILINKDDVKEGEKQLKNHSIVLCQNIREISKERLDHKITHIKDEYWKDINIAIKSTLGIDE